MSRVRFTKDSYRYVIGKRGSVNVYNRVYEDGHEMEVACHPRTAKKLIRENSDMIAKVAKKAGIKNVNFN